MQTHEHRHRWVTHEPAIPFPIRILYADDAIIVVDKPHFLPTTPRGMWYRSTALMRLREQFQDDLITPAHRLDRATAGVVLFVRDPSLRGAYQMLFQNCQVSKRYECIAPAAIVRQPRCGATRSLNPPAVFPILRESRIIKLRGTLQAFESVGEANSSTIISLSHDQRAVLEANDRVLAAQGRHVPASLWRVYSLQPRSGKTHQLRVHMNSIGLPIVGDDLYPKIRMRTTQSTEADKASTSLDDFAHPLQLVARTLEFVDPINAELRRFESQIPLEMPLPVTGDDNA
ncbi:pseudouridine synthase [Bifidobacterium aquikefiri]|uniref:pseudouridine synthase n=1 Tax=Bifidobacterium aquikefiri TaxID=1653207 RepID=UPI0023F15ED0|nr:pseudouridine synthase [Bifidobacterium aquikefiri]